jgi:hypothetical protein
LHESVDPVKACWCWASGQPFEAAVLPRDVSISARRDVDDDFSLVHHEYQFLLRRGLSVEPLLAV